MIRKNDKQKSEPFWEKVLPALPFASANLYRSSEIAKYTTNPENCNCKLQIVNGNSLILDY